MSALPSPAVLTSVRSAVYARLDRDAEAREGAYDRELLVNLCNEAIAFSWTLSKRLPEGHVGQRARSAAALMLVMAYPGMRPGLRHQLAVACEAIAMGVRQD